MICYGHSLQLFSKWYKKQNCKLFPGNILKNSPLEVISKRNIYTVCNLSEVHTLYMPLDTKDSCISNGLSTIKNMFIYLTLEYSDCRTIAVRSQKAVMGSGSPSQLLKTRELQFCNKVYIHNGAYGRKNPNMFTACSCWKGNPLAFYSHLHIKHKVQSDTHYKLW